MPNRPLRRGGRGGFEGGVFVASLHALINRLHCHKDPCTGNTFYFQGTRVYRVQLANVSNVQLWVPTVSQLDGVDSRELGKLADSNYSTPELLKPGLLFNVEVGSWPGKLNSNPPKKQESFSPLPNPQKSWTSMYT